jgi:hypothetical protein
MDEQSKRPYYLNTTTGYRLYVKPADADASSAGSALARLQSWSAQGQAAHGTAAAAADLPSQSYVGPQVQVWTEFAAAQQARAGPAPGMAAAAASASAATAAVAQPQPEIQAFEEEDDDAAEGDAAAASLAPVMPAEVASMVVQADAIPDAPTAVPAATITNLALDLNALSAAMAQPESPPLRAHAAQHEPAPMAVTAADADHAPEDSSSSPTSNSHAGAGAAPVADDGYTSPATAAGTRPGSGQSMRTPMSKHDSDESASSATGEGVDLSLHLGPLYGDPFLVPIEGPGGKRRDVCAFNPLTVVTINL